MIRYVPIWERPNSRALRLELVVRDGRRCALCGRFRDPQRMTIDHVIPVSRGGTDAIDNLRLACGACNYSRGDGRPQESLHAVLARLLGDYLEGRI